MTLGEAIEMGCSLHRRGLLPEAEAVYRQILSSKPEQPEALHFLGVVVGQMGRHEEAAGLILAALELDPGYIDALSNLGNVLRILGQHQEAEAAYRRAIELKPDFADAHVNLAGLLFDQDRFEESLAECRRAIELSPGTSESRVVAGRALAGQGKHAEAAEEYLRAIEQKEFRASVHENMAVSLLKLRRTDEATEMYRRWLRLDPDNPRPKHHLAGCTGVDVPSRAPDDYVLEVFNRFASTFDARLSALKYAAPDLVIAALAAELGTPQSQLDLLDAGCGTGLCGPGARPFARRLAGVDLSPKMLDKARQRGVYDELHEAELTEFLSRLPAAYDAILSADTLVYFGDLSAVIAAAANALRPQGRFVFTVEKSEACDAPRGFRLESHGRYSHSEDHVRGALEQSDFEVVQLREVFLRMEGHERVEGWLVVGRSIHNGVPMPAAEAPARSAGGPVPAGDF